MFQLRIYVCFYNWIGITHGRLRATSQRSTGHGGYGRNSIESDVMPSHVQLPEMRYRLNSNSADEYDNNNNSQTEDVSGYIQQQYIQDLNIQVELYKKIIKKRLSVRQVEKLVKEIKSPKTKSYNYTSPFLNQTAVELKEIFKTSVSLISNNKGKGYLKIVFDSQERLQDILNKIKGES